MKKGMRRAVSLLLLLLLLTGTAFAGDVPEIGAPFPDLTLRSVTGETYTVSGLLRGHDVLLIKLFATWSPPCTREILYLESAYEESGGRAAVIAVGIDPTEDESVLLDWAAQNGLTFPVARDSDQLLAMARELQDIPVTFVIDAGGNLVSLRVGAAPDADFFRRLIEQAGN